MPAKEHEAVTEELTSLLEYRPTHLAWPIPPNVVDEVAREFQLDEIGPTAPAGHSRIAGDVYGSEVFLQNLGDVLSRFRMNPAETVPPRERKS